MENHPGHPHIGCSSLRRQPNSMFSKDLEYSIGQCYKRAREARHEYMTVEHLLLALLENPPAVGDLRAWGADSPRRPAAPEQAVATAASVPPHESARTTQPTPAFRRWLHRAVYRVQ